MVKAVSRGQALEIIGRVATQVDWNLLDGAKLQREVIDLSPQEFGFRLTQFLKSGTMSIFYDLRVAAIPFDRIELAKDLALFKDLTFWRGPKDGNGLDGEEERDRFSLQLMEVDFSRVDFLTCLESLGEGERSITGEEKLIRLRKLNRIILGATSFMGLWHDYQSRQDKAESVLEKLYHRRKTRNIEFLGDIFRGPTGGRCVIRLFRDAVDQWHLSYAWLAGTWLNNENFSPVL